MNAKPIKGALRIALLTPGNGIVFAHNKSSVKLYINVYHVIAIGVAYLYTDSLCALNATKIKVKKQTSKINNVCHVVYS